MNNTEVNNPYDEEPVFYCKNCLSLKIRTLEDLGLDICYCEKCSNTDIEQTDIFTWEELYKNKYGHKYLKEDKYGREIRNQPTWYTIGEYDARKEEQ